MALFNAIARQISRLTKTTPVRRSQKVSSLRSEVETMEQRALLTGITVAPICNGVLHIEGSSGDDNVSVEVIKNYPFIGGANNDLLIIKSGSAVLRTLFVNTDSPSMGGTVVNKIEFSGNDGNDIFFNNTSINSELWGGNGNDVLSGGSGHDVIWGGWGCDSLSGNAGNDSLNGGSGDDLLEGGSGNDCLRGNDGDDYLYGGFGNDYLRGDDGFDHLYGGDGYDDLPSGPGGVYNPGGPNEPFHTL